MRWFLRVCVLALLAAVLVSSNAAAQNAAAFKLGFKALAERIPQVVGQPVEDEHWGANGDSLQRTTTGLMAWRKADNWTAFTNGSRTWVNGPYGVQERGNDERFEWESLAPAPDAVPIQTPPPLPAPNQPPAAPVLITRDKASSAILRLPDMAAGYETVALGWAADGQLVSEFHTEGRNYRSGPFIRSHIAICDSEAAAQSYLDRINWPGFDVQGAALTGTVASGKAFSRTWRIPDWTKYTEWGIDGKTPVDSGSDVGAEYAVFFRVRNAVGYVHLSGFYSNTTMSATLRLAQLTADRLAAQ